MVLPDGFTLSQPRPTPGREGGRRGGLDLSVDQRLLEGRSTARCVLQVQSGAQITQAWKDACDRWLDRNLSYPPRAAQEGDQGSVRVRIVASPDGTVRQVRLIVPSASPWLNSGTTMAFAGARLPPFPPGADPNGVVLELTVNYILIRR